MTDLRPGESKSSTGRKVAIIIAGAAASVLVALSFSPTLAGFTASITNGSDTAGIGALSMQETNPAGTGTTCNSTDGGSISTDSATCSTVNLYGSLSSMAPGQTVTTDVTITDTGSVPANSFSLTPGACAQSNNGIVNGTATDLCAQATLVVTSGKSATTIYSGPLSTFNAGAINILSKTSATSVAPGDSVSFTFALTMPSTLNNTYSGLQVSQPITWTFNS